MPCVTMIAGPNGSGKSTLIGLLKDAGIDFGDYLNADDIARNLAGSAESIAAQAQAEVRGRRQKALDEGRDHSFETVLSHPSHIDHLKLAKAAGFEVIVYFVATDDPFINIGRVANRVQHGGHDVPRERISMRYVRSLDNLPAALAIANEAAVFDNSSPNRPMQMVAELSGGKLRQSQPESAQPNWWRERLATIKAALS